MVISTGQMPILGVVRGALAPSSTASVLFTLSVPSRARAGVTEVARVRFTSPGAVPVEVPVQVEVAPSAAIDLRVLDGAPMVVRGQRLSLRYSLANLGNRAEEVRVTALLPPGWRALGDTPLSVTLGVNERHEQLLLLDVASHASTGSATVQLVASIGERPVATAEVRVAVLETRRSEASGPLLTTGLVVAQGHASDATYAYSAALEGELAPGVRVSGRLQASPPQGAGANMVSYRLGASGLPSRLELSAQDWRVGIGYAGMTLDELTGHNVMGMGASSTIQRGPWSVSAVAARPGTGRPGDRREGTVAGGRIERRAGSLVLAATGSHLFESGYEDRRLDALGVSAAMPDLWDGKFSAELAQRRFASGSGLGYSARYTRRTPTSHLDARLTHAPGGRRAFAQAADQVSVQAGRALTRFLGVHAGYWHSRDGNTASFSRLASRGLNGGTTLRISEAMSFGLAARQSRFEAVGSGGAFSTIEQALEASLSMSAGALVIRGRSSLGSTRRETGGSLGAPGTTESGRRLTLDGSVGHRSGVGYFSLDARYERTGPGSGSLPVRAELAARAEGVPIIGRGALQVRAMAELRQTYWPGFGPSRSTLAAGLTADLPFGFAVELAAERNPFLVGADGRPEWLYGLRIERSTRLPALAREETRGVVYHDVNGNGRRDPGEPGFAGAVVQRGGVGVVSDAKGTYRLPGATGGPGTLDPFSLGHGWITGAVSETGGRREIAVIPVSPIRVLLAIDDHQGRGVASDLLAPAAVLARDGHGRVWVARRDGADDAFFDALPAGRYTLELDLLEVKEPLRVVGALPSFTVGVGKQAEPIVVRLRPREMQIRQLDPNGAVDHGEARR
jgi:hypothetical protein